MGSGIEVPGYDRLELVTHTDQAQTYRAVRRPAGEPVSVKVWSVTLPDERGRRRFLREARQAGERRHHPGLARVLDAGIVGPGRPFVVTEPLPAPALDGILAVDGPLPVAAVLEFGVGLADALAALHDAGAVHGRIDPSVVFPAPGRPLLGDVGTEALAEALARVAGPALRPRYFAAPEQLERGAVDPASDVYSLAAVVYAALTGRAPHEPADPATPDSAPLLLLRTLQSDPPPLARPDVPPPLVTALHQALAPTPSTRTPSARAFATALQELRRAAPGVPVPVTATTLAPDPVSVADLEDHWPGAEPSMGPVADAPSSPVWSPSTPAPVAGHRTGPATADVPAPPAERAPVRMAFHPIEDEPPRPAVVPPPPPPLLAPPAPPPPAAPSTAARRGRPVGLAAGAVVAALAVAVVVAVGATSSGDGDPPRPDPTVSTTAPADPTSDTPDAAGPTGLGAVETDAGVRLGWEGEATRYAVLVMSETTAPVVLVAEDGPGYVVPPAELRADVGYCFAVADMAAVEAGGADTESAFTPPVCIRGASEATVRSR